MAIVQEQYELGGRTFIRTYSDSGKFIHGGFPEGDYAEANDPADLGRVYTETDIPTDTNAEEIVNILTGDEE